MRAPNSLKAAGRQNASKPATQFRQPDNCPVAVCSAIVMYEQELERHRATESSLRESLLRESDLLRQKDELILQKDILAKERHLTSRRTLRVFRDQAMLTWREVAVAA